ncbi:unnamed protein product [Owenia fusiformis]|uniref:Methyltransferase-like protein 5 n=1 Tax=Owenia fusiformis TaxID=6347 RepID=A0A8J1UGV5_OWEFU|nr:unnamed protein product [Owenia fusiformis]
MACMKLQKLQGYLEDVDIFENPKILLEQYHTSPEIAAQMIYLIAFNDDNIQDKCIADLGCGCGMLGIAACMMECGQCVGFDIDEDALAICRYNLEEKEIENMELVQCDVTKMELGTKWNEKFDTVIMNPPFGTKKNAGLDLLFLRQAIAMTTSTGAVYSLHKTSTRKHIEKVVRDSWELDITVVAELHFELPKKYMCHKKASVDIYVDLIKVTKPEKKRSKEKVTKKHLMSS